MPVDVTPWVVIGPFMAAIAATVVITVRMMLRGTIVAGRHYEDSLRREAAWQKVAETALTAAAEQSGNIVRLVATIDQLTGVTRETQGLVRQLMPSERAA